MKRLAGNLLLLLIAVLLPLAAFEVFLRCFYNYEVTIKQMTEFDPDLGWRLVPGTYHVRRSHALISHDIYVNALGMRNREISLQPSAGTQRVILLGDSFTFGMMVPTEDLLASVAERKMNSASRFVEIVNTGRQGFGTAQQLIQTRRLHEQGFSADLYIVMFYTNDLVNNLGLSPRDLKAEAALPAFALNEQGEATLARAPEYKFRPGSGVRRSGGRFRLHTKDFVISRVMGIVQTQSSLLKLAQTLGFDGPRTWRPSMIRSWYDDTHCVPGWKLPAPPTRTASGGARSGR